MRPARLMLVWGIAYTVCLACAVVYGANEYGDLAGMKREESFRLFDAYDAYLHTSGLALGAALGLGSAAWGNSRRSPRAGFWSLVGGVVLTLLAFSLLPDVVRQGGSIPAELAWLSWAAWILGATWTLVTLLGRWRIDARDPAQGHTSDEDDARLRPSAHGQATGDRLQAVTWNVTSCS